MARRKEETRFDAAEVEKAILELEKKENLKLSLSELMRFNIQRFKDTGLSRRTIYDRLIDSGLNLGTFNAFSLCWTRVEKSGIFVSADTPSKRDSPVSAGVAEEVVNEPDKSADREREELEVKTPEKPKKKYNPALRPIYVNGVEVEIDPETGGKTFKI